MVLVLELRTSRVKNSLYVLIPRGLARGLGIGDQSVFQLTIEESDGTVRLVYQHDNTQADAGEEVGSKGMMDSLPRIRVPRIRGQ
jgi:hypothetical protein